MDYYSQFLTPAIIAGVLAYLVNFFGKAITDQASVVDDRKWHAQISGTLFMTNMLTGLPGIYLAVRFHLGVGHWWLHAVTSIILVFLWASLIHYGRSETVRIYKDRIKEFTREKERYGKASDVLMWFGKNMGVVILPFILFYLGTLEYLSKNPYWIVAITIIIFIMFVQFAYNSSLKIIGDIVPVTIYFTEKGRPELTAVTILKEKEDSYRVRVGNKIMLLNKSEISQIEMVLPERLL